MQYDDLEFINSRNVLNCIERGSDDLSRAKIAKEVGLSRTSVSIIVQRLINLGLVSEHEAETSGARGRPGTPLSLNPDVWHSAGACYHYGKWHFVAINALMQVKRTRVRTVSDNSREAIVSALLDGLDEMRSCCPGKMLPAFGIGAPGLIDYANGTICRADDLGWDSPVELRRIVREHTGLPSYVLNRYCADSLMEVASRRYGQKYRNIVYLGIGTGMGGAVFHNGVLSTGVKSRLGHIIIDPNGPACNCGQRGCIQTLASEDAWVRIAEQLGVESPGGELSGSSIARMAQKGDPMAMKCVDIVADNISMAIGIIVNAFAPDLIVIGGPLGASSDYLLERIRVHARSRLLDWQFNGLAIERGDPDVLCGAIGAAMFAQKFKLELILNNELVRINGDYGANCQQF